MTKMMLRWDRSDVRESLMALAHWPKREGWRLLSIPVVLAHVIGTLLGACRCRSSRSTRWLRSSSRTR